MTTSGSNPVRFNGGFIDGGGGGGFVEQDHPRDAQGKFTDKGGGSSGGEGGSGSGESGGEGGSAASSSGSGGNAKPSLARPGFHRGTDEERAALKIPPGWTDVHISDDPHARLVAVGRDSKGRQQSRYSAEHSAAALVEKFERGRALNAALPGILYQVEREIDEEGRNLEEASVLRLIAATGFRIGSDADTQAKVKAYGASTLEARHVTIEGSVTHFDFIGKKGVRQQHSIDDAELAADMQARKDAAGGETGKLFRTNDAKVRDFLKKAAGGQSFKVHDLRTWNATDTARRAVQEIEPPKSAEEFWEKRDEAGQRAARKIGDTLDMALSTYVDPLVFEDWRTRAGVAPDAERPAKRKRKAEEAGA